MTICENIHALVRDLKIQRKLPCTWKYQFEGRPEPRHAISGTAADDRADKQLRDEIATLKTALAYQTLENDLLRAALFKVQEGRRPSPGRIANRRDIPFEERSPLDSDPLQNRSRHAARLSGEHVPNVVYCAVVLCGTQPVWGNRPYGTRSELSP